MSLADILKTKTEKITKLPDGSYEIVTTLTKKVSKKTIEGKVSTKESEILKIKTDYPEVFPVVKPLEIIEVIK